MFCGKCGTKLDDNAKFCGKCGTKVNKPTDTNVTGLDSFIGNIVKKTNEQSKDEDIFSQLETNEDKSSSKKKKKEKTKSKAKSKPKPKPKVKKNKKSAPKKERKKINIKVIIIILSVILLLAAGAGIFIFFKYGDDIFANSYVKSSVAKTFKQLDKYSEKGEMIPNLVLRKNLKDKLAEREIYLEIKNSKGGLINEDILGSLKGLSIKTNEKYNSEKDLFNAKLTFANSKKEEIYGEIFSSPTVATISIPELYSDILGITLGESEEGIANSEYQTKIAEIVGLLSEYETIYTDCNKAVKDKSTVLAENIFTNCKYEIESKDDESGVRVYNTTLNNKAVLEAIKSYLTEIKTDEHIKKTLAYASYLLDKKSLQFAEVSVDEKIDKLIANVDNAVESERVEDIDLKIVINKDKVINHLTFNTVIDGIGVAAVFELENNDNIIDYKINIKLSNQDSYIAFDIESSLEAIDDVKINKKNVLTFSTSYDDKIELSFDKDYNLKDHKYDSNISFDVDSIFEDLFITYDLNAKCETETDFEKLNIDSLKLNINADLYKFYFDFSGYVQQQNSGLIEDIKLDDVIFVDNMSEKELEDINLEIHKNGYEFLDLFGKGEW